jgi:opacity protein-like surface antigen
MKKLYLAVVSAVLVSSAALAAPLPAPGHFEWRSASQTGPRAAPVAPHRVWIADASASACSCPMKGNKAA